MIGQVDFNNPSNYKNCSRKQYDAYVCMPAINTVVINKIEQPLVVKILGKDYFTAEELKVMKASNIERFNMVSQAVSTGQAHLVNNSNPFVLCGTLGELSTISVSELSSMFTFLQNGQPLQINHQSLSARIKCGYLDWSLVRANSYNSCQYMAYFVPKSHRGEIYTYKGKMEFNNPDIEHGNGDFIVCSKLPDGRPNLNDKIVVNGNIFSSTFSNQGWGSCVNTHLKSLTIADLPVITLRDESYHLEKFFKILRSNLSDLLEVFDPADTNKMILKVNGDNNNSLVLSLTLSGDKVLVSANSNKTRFLKGYSIIDKSSAELAERDILKTLGVSPIRRQVKSLASINSKYRISDILFKTSKEGFLFRFTVNNDIIFTYSCNVSDNSIMFVRCFRSSGRSLPYNLNKSGTKIYFSEKAILGHIDFIFTQESDSWKYTFEYLVNTMRCVKSFFKKFSYQVVNKGDNQYWFSTGDYDFVLEGFSSNSFKFRVNQVHPKIVFSESLIINRGILGEDLHQLIESFISGLGDNKVNTRNISILEKLYKDFDSLVWSDNVQKKLHRFDDTFVNASFLYRIFLVLSDILDRPIYINDSFRMLGEDEMGVGFSLDDEIFIISYRADCDEFIIINDRQVIFDGVLEVSLDDVDVFLRSLVHADDLPRYFSKLYNYDFRKDFWFSMDSIADKLSMFLEEVKLNGYLSSESYDSLSELCKFEGSRVKLSDSELRSLIKH